MCACVHLYMCVCMDVDMCRCMDVCMCTCINVCMCAFVHVWMWTCWICACTYMYIVVISSMNFHFCFTEEKSSGILEHFYHLRRQWSARALYLGANLNKILVVDMTIVNGTCVIAAVCCVGEVP